MNINKRIRALVDERLALLERAKSAAESMRAIPQTKHVKHEFSMVRISDLSPDDQAKIIRFTHKER